MYDIYYDFPLRGDFDLHETFRGTLGELLDHISDLFLLGCNKIEYYEVI